MTVLGIDTATRRGSVALAAPGTVLATADLRERGAHARDLLREIDRLLRETGLAPSDLAGIGVTVGPGSFTGVRVGLATAKGLGYSLDVPLKGLSTLEALARAALRGATEAPALLCAALDAGRGDVYAALFRVEGAEPVRVSPDRSHRPADLARALSPGAWIVGDGAAAVLGASGDRAPGLRAIDPTPAIAGPLALWACGRIGPGETYRAGEPRPNYVRPSDAEAARR